MGLACLLTACATGCGSSGPGTTTSSASPKPSPPALVRSCLRKAGYAVTAESAADVRTAPARFEFTAVWNLLNPDRVALAMTFSRNTSGAEQAATWTRRTNKKISRGSVSAPVVRMGTIDMLWTAKPGALDARDVYGCVRTIEPGAGVTKTP